jgi:hypothetical protein
MDAGVFLPTLETVNYMQKGEDRERENQKAHEETLRRPWPVRA